MVPRRRNRSRSRSPPLPPSSPAQFSPAPVSVRIVAGFVSIMVALLFFGAVGQALYADYSWGLLSRDPINLTLAELRTMIGEDGKSPIYIAVYGKIYDVSSNRRIYGPGGSYGFFAGRDAIRAYATGCFDKVECLTGDVSGLTTSQMNSVKHWVDFYHDSKDYGFVGYVVDEGTGIRTHDELEWVGSNEE